MIRKPSATLFLDKRATVEEGRGVVKVCVTYKRVQRLYSTGIKAEVSEWQKLQRGIDEYGISQKIKNPQLIEAYKKLYVDHDSDLNRAKQVIKFLEFRFTFDDFKYFFENPNEMKDLEISEKNFDVIKSLLDKSKLLFQEERVATASGYEYAATSLSRFIKSLSKAEKAMLRMPVKDNEAIKLHFDNLTVAFLNKYEKWMLKYGRTIKGVALTDCPATETTIGFYLRNVKSIYNEAILEGIVKREKSPFKKNGYQIPSGKGNKRALPKSDIDKILAYTPDYSVMEAQSWALWVFSYINNGMNISDICRLQKSDIDLKAKKIRFVRKKTQNATKSNKQVIETVIFELTENILIKFGCKDQNNDFAFPFLRKENDELANKKTIRVLIGQINKDMAEIANRLGIEGNTNTYSARHSFATILLRSNAPLAFISQSLGHTSINTTQAYFGRYEDEQTKEYLKALF